MKQLKDTQLFVIPVPMDAHDFEDTYANGVMWKDKDGYYDSYYWDEDTPGIEIIGICTADHIDFDPEPFVEKTKHYTWGGYGYAKTEDVFINYMHIDVGICRSALDSFRTLLTANDVHFVNPYKKPKAIDYGGFSEFYKDALACYKEVESKLVEKILILKPL